MKLLENPSDIVGRKINYLTVVRYLGSIRTGKHNRYRYACVCTCGERIELFRASLTGKRPQESCSCKQYEANGAMLSARHTRHGLSSSFIYVRWQSMMRRCYDRKNRCFGNYGGRGIKVCKRWHKFENFFEDVGFPPTKKHSLDRIDVHGSYRPGNWRWATSQEQHRNRSNNRRIAAFGETLLLCEWAERTGLSALRIRQRIDISGWSVEAALTTAVPPRRTRDGGTP